MAEDMFDSKSIDQLERERGICMENHCEVRKYFKLLQDCQQRLERKPFTAENCHQEMCDLMEAIDHCVLDKAFAKFA